MGENFVINLSNFKWWIDHNIQCAGQFESTQVKRQRILLATILLCNMELWWKKWGAGQNLEIQWNWSLRSDAEKLKQRTNQV
jgi:hypothetical protein